MMKKQNEYQFCMAQFKPAIVGLAVLLVLVLAWTGYHCTRHPHMSDLTMAAAVTPSGPPIGVKDKMLHPYWGNCNKCHITTDAGQPVSQVMAGSPISIKDKMLHDYWGNCLLCHKVTDGFQPKGKNAGKPKTAVAAAFTPFTPERLGLKLQQVTGALMTQLGLANEDGLLVLDVTPGSMADAAGLKKGDELIRAGKVRLESLNGFTRAFSNAKPGSTVKINIFRGKKQRNIFLKLKDPVVNSNSSVIQRQQMQPQAGMQPAGTIVAAPAASMTQNQIETLAEQLGVPKTAEAVNNALAKQRAQQQQQSLQNGRIVAANTAPMTQNQIETLAEQLGVPKTAQAVNNALARQRAHQQGQNGALQGVAGLNFGKVAIASTGQDITSPVASVFGSSPGFIVFEPQQRSYNVVTNPNVNDQFGQGIQTGQYMVDIGVSNVIAGSFTPEALSTLHGLRINVFQGVTGSVQDVLAAYLAGNLMPTNSAQAESYPYGQGAIAPYAQGTMMPYTQGAMIPYAQGSMQPNATGAGVNGYGNLRTIY
ncbi:Modular magnetosome protein with a multi-heme binding domain (MamT), a trypsin-like PDZ-serine protease domain (MamE C-ter) and a iron-molybdenum cofactor maturation domain (NifB). Homology with gene DMR_41100 = mamT of RS-1 and mamT MMP [Desulfamplus magnetovallimortis]|uniref:PDZ domain-containing protein n=2 Tax=Desulfamplus magnetovallimortis TaxID=1246637 RepID=L0R548_9BACT|nr:PDZ domain-containing protein [Desulfamplus magnetovallimortis]AET24923.1 magnetosome protein [Desulfamplus magnetovallimortis BW-1]CCO06677.1 Modular magnetosome protein with a multi-heme binding domain (MamT), a trypsin-like PDZ-serine protease domain (MamE C-ter) and a iron-molybdenum cofactor maturation domain (NifB). Homology with gene DMR_41100 = mamT of RS-1 and mamT MMP [Desulfamplus magnetovallimortis BW-1]SLM32728.1 Modular magnetosome protein with a multi-heme binding domain (MamT)